ncbi:MAG: hypothetical protein ABR583_01015 [Gaiellaceae bacterium]
MEERTSRGDGDNKQGSEREAGDAVRSPAERAKERERELEESGEENAG